jgi:GNAT superfamily N-acetyltransferase
MCQKGWTIQKLTAQDHIDGFSCGQPELDLYLTRYALMNQQSDSAATYVLKNGKTVVGYYSLAVGSVEHRTAPSRMAKGLAKHPIPVMLLARMAVSSKFQRQGWGQVLLKNALIRTTQAGDIAGIRALLVHAKNDEARNWYLAHGFYPSPTDPLHLFVLLKDVAVLLS